MRREINLNNDWTFIKENKEEKINIPHTYNNIDGQDGGNDYFKGKVTYLKTFTLNDIKDDECVYLQFDGVNSVCDVSLNDIHLCLHKGGYSRFIINITSSLKEENKLKVDVDNTILDDVYPQAADFTFYGGIYRDVKIIIVNKNHFKFLKYSSPSLKITPTIKDKDGIININYELTNPSFKVKFDIYDKENNLVLSTFENKNILIKDVHLWNGIKDPYLYNIVASLFDENNNLCDQVSEKIGFRTFFVDPKKGFYLNGKSYMLRGVARHQDRRGKGNAISKEDMIEDINLIKEVGANTIRLSHYQHDDYFYKLCDEYGFIVWAEIPYISKYYKESDKNAESQLLELINQNYNHTSIVCYGISNEITMFRRKFGKDCRNNHKYLNELAHKEDPTRLTTIACFSVMSIFNRIAHITDLASYNLYWGWYMPFTKVTCFVLDLWHLFYPKSPIGLSEYGAEGMINLHSSKPKRFDNTEEYQALYHERMLKGLMKRKYIWSTHVWNMFDFGSDGRNQGGEKGVNHKGLVTFDHKTRKDAFYIYKAYLSDEKFIHITSKRFINRTGNKAIIKVYSNLNQVSLYNNGKLIATKNGDKVFKFKIKLEKENKLLASSSGFKDEALIIKVDKKDKSYILPKGGNNMSWQK